MVLYRMLIFLESAYLGVEFVDVEFSGLFSIRVSVEEGFKSRNYLVVIL